MYFDRAEISGPARITKDGYFVADAMVARANNIQEYFACEMGLTDREANDIVRVFRPAAEVFHKDALASLAHRPITLDHPSVPVKSNNWKDYAVGDVGDEVVRDGEFVRVPIKIMDSAAIASIKSDRREFSLGYTAEMVAQPGFHDGQHYDFVAKNFRYNHLAAVSAARGGAELRIIDERVTPEPLSKKEPSMAGTIVIDGLPVNLGDEAAVRAVFAKKDEAIAASIKETTDARAQVSTLTGEKTALEKQLADAKAALEPAAIDKLVADRAALVTRAKAVDANLVTDGKTDAEIRRAVVEAKLGDDAKAMDDGAIAGAFAVLAAAKPTQDAAPVQNIAPARPATIADGAAVVAHIRASRYA